MKQNIDQKTSNSIDSNKIKLSNAVPVNKVNFINNKNNFSILLESLLIGDCKFLS